jgi:hypothetical protein
MLNRPQRIAGGFSIFFIVHGRLAGINTRGICFQKIEFEVSQITVI